MLRGASIFLLVVATGLGGSRRRINHRVRNRSPDVSGEDGSRLRLVSPGDDDPKWLGRDCFLTILLHSALTLIGCHTVRWSYRSIGYAGMDAARK